jgi:hypothetical protein
VNAAKGDRAVYSSKFCILAINAGEKIPGSKNKMHRAQVAKDINFPESFSWGKSYRRKGELGYFKAAAVILAV